MAPPGSQRSCTSGGPFTLLSLVCVCARMCAWVCTSVFVAVNAMTAAADPAANIRRPVSPTSSAAQAYAIHAGRRGFNERWQSRRVYAAAPIERRLPSMMPHRVTCRPTGGQMSMPRAGQSAATQLSSPTRQRLLPKYRPLASRPSNSPRRQAKRVRDDKPPSDNPFFRQPSETPATDIQPTYS